MEGDAEMDGEDVGDAEMDGVDDGDAEMNGLATLGSGGGLSDE